MVGQHHFPESIRITKEEFENIVGVAKKILSEKTVDPQLVEEFEYYMKCIRFILNGRTITGTAIFTSCAGTKDWRLKESR